MEVFREVASDEAASAGDQYARQSLTPHSLRIKRRFRLNFALKDFETSRDARENEAIHPLTGINQ